MERTRIPACCRARIAASRPGPGPCTSTSTSRTPASCSAREVFCAAICAAYGVLLREPLNPLAPALPHAITFPDWSVKVTIVLLKLAWIWTLPYGTDLRSLRPPRRTGRRGAAPVVFSSAIHFPPRVFRACAYRHARKTRRLLLLRLGAPATGHGLACTAFGSCVSTRALAAHRQVAAMPQPAISANFLHTLDIHGDLAAQITFHF